MNYIVTLLNDYNKVNGVSKIEDWKLKILRTLLLLIVFIFVVRLVYIQVYEYKKYTAMAVDNYTQKQYVFPNRGIIFDSQNNPLVANKAKYVAILDLSTLNRFKKYSSLESVLTLEETKLLTKYKIVYQDKDSIDKFNKALSVGKDYIVLKEFIDYSEYASFLSDTSALNSLLISVSEEVYREYAKPDIYSHILGYTTSVSLNDLIEDNWYTANAKTGAEGLEKKYENYLRGEKGLLNKSEYSDAKIKDVSFISEPKNGYDLYTSINSEIQETAYLALAETITKFNAKGGAVVVQNPNTGEVIAMISLPSYDNNIFSKGISLDQYNLYLNDSKNPLINKVISANYPPGSTFKLVMAYAGLVEKSLSKSDLITDVGVINVGSFSFKTWKEGGHGIIDIIGALKQSSDTFFYILGGGHANYPQIKALGPWNIYKYAKIFGFGEVTGVDLPGEVPGFIPNPDWKQKNLAEPWYIGNTYHMSIGQGFVLATPMQTNVMTSAIANGGTLFRPYVVKKVVDTKESKVIMQNIPSNYGVLKLDQETLSVIKQGMVESVLPGGTAYPLFDFPIKIAGKTGTSEFGENENKKTHAWFTAFAPAENPAISVTVLVEEGGGGSDVAVPVAKKILEKFFKIDSPVGSRQ